MRHERGAPLLWRSELRNLLAGYRRDDGLGSDQTRSIMSAAEAGLARGRGEHHLPSDRAFSVIEQGRLSACPERATSLESAIVIQ